MPRLDLHATFLELVDYAYFQPPEDIQMSYPCIVYRKDPYRTQHAGNSPYSYRTRYTVTVIDPDPDTTIPLQVAMMESARPDRNYTANRLNHYVFSLTHD